MNYPTGTDTIENISLLPKEEARKHFNDLTTKLDLKHTFSFDEVYDFLMERRLAKQKEKFRNKIVEFENIVKSVPNSFGADPFPLTHNFADGMYIRQLIVPARTLTVTKIHAQTHPFFLLKGTISILTEEGVKKITAPYSGITKKGTKRIIWHHDEVMITTVHRTNETDLEKIEEEVIAKNFEELNDVQIISDFLDVISEEESI